MQDFAAALGIPLTTLDTHPVVDLDLDGADEIDPHLSLLKGGGGALLREKIVASAARRFIVVADSSKQVTHLGEHTPIAVETAPLGLTPVRKRLEAQGATVQIRYRAGRVFVIDNQNVILDCRFPYPIGDPEALDAQIHQIVGVVETGFFFHLANQVVIGDLMESRCYPDQVENDKLKTCAKSKAMQAFFRRVKNGEKSGFPRARPVISSSRSAPRPSMSRWKATPY